MFLENIFERFNYHQSFHPVFVLKVAEMKTQNKPLPQSCFKIQWKFLLSQTDAKYFNRTSKILIELQSFDKLGQ